MERGFTYDMLDWHARENPPYCQYHDRKHLVDVSVLDEEAVCVLLPVELEGHPAGLGGLALHAFEVEVVEVMVDSGGHFGSHDEEAVGSEHQYAVLSLVRLDLLLDLILSQYLCVLAQDEPDALVNVPGDGSPRGHDDDEGGTFYRIKTTVVPCPFLGEASGSSTRDSPLVEAPRTSRISFSLTIPGSRAERHLSVRACPQSRHSIRGQYFFMCVHLFTVSSIPRFTSCVPSPFFLHLAAELQCVCLFVRLFGRRRRRWKDQQQQQQDRAQK